MVNKYEEIDFSKSFVLVKKTGNVPKAENIHWGNNDKGNEEFFCLSM